MKQSIIRLKQDILNWYKGIIVAIVYLVLTNILFGTVCSMVIVTGMPCPACGLTRAGIAVLTFQWETAWNYNFVIFMIIPFICYLFICRYILNCKCRFLVPGLVVIVVSLMALYLYRMIHVFPTKPPMEYHDCNLLRFIEIVFL